MIKENFDTFEKIAKDICNLAHEVCGEAKSDGGVEDGNRIHELGTRLNLLIGKPPCHESFCLDEDL
jgi:hypothetical protein